MIGIHKLFLCLAGGGAALTSCAVAIPMSLNTNKNPTEHKVVSVETREEKREPSKSIAEVSFNAQKDKEIKEGLKRNLDTLDIKWRPFCGVSPSSLCLIPWIN